MKLICVVVLIVGSLSWAGQVCQAQQSVFCRSDLTTISRIEQLINGLCDLVQVTGCLVSVDNTSSCVCDYETVERLTLLETNFLPNSCAPGLVTTLVPQTYDFGNIETSPEPSPGLIGVDHSAAAVLLQYPGVEGSLFKIDHIKILAGDLMMTHDFQLTIHPMNEAGFPTQAVEQTFTLGPGTGATNEIVDAVPDTRPCLQPSTTYAVVLGRNPLTPEGNMTWFFSATEFSAGDLEYYGSLQYESGGWTFVQGVYFMLQISASTCCANQCP